MNDLRQGFAMQNPCAIIVLLVGTPCLAGQSCSMKSPVLGKTIDTDAFSSPATNRENFPGEFDIDFSMSCNQTVWCLQQ